MMTIMGLTLVTMCGALAWYDLNEARQPGAWRGWMFMAGVMSFAALIGFGSFVISLMAALGVQL